MYVEEHHMQPSNDNMYGVFVDSSRSLVIHVLMHSMYKNEHFLILTTGHISFAFHACDVELEDIVLYLLTTHAF